MDISCIILAGGKSIRLGHDKVLEKFGNRSLLEQVISRIETLGKNIIIVTAAERTFDNLAEHPKVKIVSDIFPGKGSLGGIYTGLANSDSFYNLVTASDMPFLNQPLLRYMIEVADGFDFVLPRIKNLFEPLHAIYSKNCLAPMEEMLKTDRKVIMALSEMVKVRYVDAPEIDRYDPQHLSFFNINTRDDLKLARSILTEEN